MAITLVNLLLGLFLLAMAGAVEEEEVDRALVAGVKEQVEQVVREALDQLEEKLDQDFRGFGRNIAEIGSRVWEVRGEVEAVLGLVVLLALVVVVVGAVVAHHLMPPSPCCLLCRRSEV